MAVAVMKKSVVGSMRDKGKRMQWSISFSAFNANAAKAIAEVTDQFNEYLAEFEQTFSDEQKRYVVEEVTQKTSNLAFQPFDGIGWWYVESAILVFRTYKKEPTLEEREATTEDFGLRPEPEAYSLDRAFSYVGG